MGVDVARLMIAGTASGAGKTTVTCGLLALLKARGLAVRACKVGPDYLDPAFHEQVLGIPSRNLDLYLGSADLVRSMLVEGGEAPCITIVEGVMGYYDGIATSDAASSYAVARATDTPVVLVVDARGRALSVAAEVAGFVRFREPSQVAGVILNRVTPSYYPQLRAAVERETGVPVLGYVPRVEAARLESRHLGLIAAEEVHDLQERVGMVARELERSVDVDALLAIALQAPSLLVPPLPGARTHREGAEPVIAVAYDAAFSFYYHDTLALLKRLGARLAYFSPLAGEGIPTDACGLYLGGGYPELHAEELSAHKKVRDEVREAIAAGMPTIAECGGFLYLHQTLEDEQGVRWPMVGALPGHAVRGERLGRFGYVTLTARHDSLVARAGEEIRAHEFHYWQSDTPGNAFCAQKPASARSWDMGVATPTLYAGFPHLYLCGCPVVAERFVEACASNGLMHRGGHA